MKSESLFRAIGRIDPLLIEEADKIPFKRKRVFSPIKWTSIAAGLVVIVGIALLIGHNSGLMGFVEHPAINGSARVSDGSAVSNRSSGQYDGLYAKIGANSSSGGFSGAITARNGPMIAAIDLSKFGIPGSATTAQAAAVGSDYYVLVTGKDNASLHLVVLDAGKTKLYADIDCAPALKTLLGASGAQSALSDIKIYDYPIPVRNFGDNLTLSFSIGNSDNVKTILLVYSLKNPEKPTLSGAFGQSGTVSFGNPYQVNGNVLTLITQYTASQPKRSDPESFVPCTAQNGVNSFVPAKHIFAGTGTANQYSVVSQWDLSGAPSLMESYAFLGQGVSNAYVFGDEIIVPETTQTTTEVNKIYGPWQDVPKDLITPQTGTKLRNACTVSVIASHTKLSLYTAGGDGLCLTSAVTLSGAPILGQNCIDLYQTNFRVILGTSTNAEGGGGYENAEGAHVELNDNFRKEGFTHIPSPPDLSKYVKNGAALYIFDGSLRQIGTIPQITSLGVDAVSFKGNTAVLSTQSGKIVLDLSNPAATVKRQS